MEKNIREVALIDLGQQDDFSPGDKVILQSAGCLHDWLTEKAIEVESKTSDLVRQAIVTHLNGGGDLPALSAMTFGDKLFISMKTGGMMAIIGM